LKGTSAGERFNQNLNFRQRLLKGHFWDLGKFYITVGDDDAEKVIYYIQKYQFKQIMLDIFSTTTKHAS